MKRVHPAWSEFACRFVRSPSAASHNPARGNQFIDNSPRKCEFEAPYALASRTKGSAAEVATCTKTCTKRIKADRNG